MRNISLAVAVLILSHFLHSGDCVPSTATQAMYEEILARAQQRKVASSAASVEERGDTWNRRKYSAQQAKLIQDVTLIFGHSISVSEKFEYFKRLMTDLGLEENPVSIGRFKHFAGLINRKMNGESLYRCERSKIAPEVIAKLHEMLSENPTLTYLEASEGLKISGVVPLPTATYLQNWLQNRQKESGFLKMLEPPFLYPRTAAQDDFSCSFSVFTDEEEGEKDSLKKEDIKLNDRKRKAEDESLPRAIKKVRWVDEDLYNDLLTKARARRGQPSQPISASNKHTIEHTELIADIVSTCEFLHVGEQYEVFCLLSENLGIPGMSKNKFYGRARSVRQKIGCSVLSRCVLDPETTKVIKSIFDANPNISPNEAYSALQNKDGHVPSLRDIRRWLKSHKSHLLRSKKRQALLYPGESTGGQPAGSSTENYPHDEAIGNLVSELLAPEHDTP